LGAAPTLRSAIGTNLAPIDYFGTQIPVCRCHENVERVDFERRSLLGQSAAA
jgi:hypothetical protein